MAAKTTKELSDEEIEDYKEAFSNFDKDGNGNIDEGELGVVMRSLGYSPTNQQLKEMMAKVSAGKYLYMRRVLSLSRNVSQMISIVSALVLWCVHNL